MFAEKWAYFCYILIFFPACGSGRGGENGSFYMEDSDLFDTGSIRETGELDEEICDGLDNDTDGKIDEGFDSDGDQIADCFQCSVDNGLHVEIGEDVEECDLVPQDFVDTWDIVEKWARYSSSKAPWSYGCVNPVVVDLDKDGFSDIICSTYKSDDNNVYVLNGQDGSIEWSYEGAAELAITAVADLDGDSWFEVLFLDKNGYLVVTTDLGLELWKSNEVLGSSWENDAYCEEDWDSYCNLLGPVVVFDIDKDGEWEIVTPTAILESADMSVSAYFDIDFENDSSIHGSIYRNGSDVSFFDADRDGIDEIFFANKVYSSDGSIYLSYDYDVLSGYNWTNSVIADWGSGGDIVLFDYHSFSVFSSGDRIYNHNDSLYLSNNGLNCVGDINGDGVDDVIIATGRLNGTGGSEIQAWDRYGIKWSIESTLFGPGYCSVFDFDGNGSDEVIVSGNNRISILNGESGEEIYVLTRPGLEDIRGYVSAVSMVVDMDGDGSADLVIASPVATSKGEPAVRVLSHAAGLWSPGGRIWPWSSWSGVGMHWDGRPQTDQPPSWEYPGRYRGQAQVHKDGADLQPFVYDSCVAEAEARLSVGVENLGPYAVNGLLGVEVVDGAGSVVAEGSLLRTLEPDQRSETIEVRLSPAQAQEGVEIRVTTEASPDCNLRNNVLFWRADPTETE